MVKIYYVVKIHLVIKIYFLLKIYLVAVASLKSQLWRMQSVHCCANGSVKWQQNKDHSMQLHLVRIVLKLFPTIVLWQESILPTHLYSGFALF